MFFKSAPLLHPRVFKAFGAPDVPTCRDVPRKSRASVVRCLPFVSPCTIGAGASDRSTDEFEMFDCFIGVSVKRQINMGQSLPPPGRNPTCGSYS